MRKSIALLVVLGVIGLGPMSAYAVDPGKIEAIAQQAVMIENDQALSAITGDPAYLTKAVNLAETFMAQKPQQPINQLIFLRAIRKLNAVSPLLGYEHYLGVYRNIVLHYSRQHGRVVAVKHHLLNAPGALENVIYMWPFAQVITAELEHGNTTAISALKYYYDRQAHAFAVTARIEGKRVTPLGSTFCDDNDWGGLAYEQAWTMTHQAEDLKFAKIIATYENHACWNNQYGGERWVLSPTNFDLSSVSTAGGEQLDLRLYKDTGDSRYLAYAMRADAWMRSKMQAPNGGYYDHITIKPQGGTTYKQAAVGYHHEAARGEIDVLSFFVAKLELSLG